MANSTKALETFAEIEPWDQIIGDPVRGNEPTYWYGCFTFFRLMGPRRKLARAFRLYNAENRGEPAQYDKPKAATWIQMAELWNWDQRAEAWDREQIELMEAIAHTELNEGLSLIHERVRSLKLISRKLELYLLDPHNTRLSPGTLEQYRGLLDDIARELGHRIRETRLTGTGGGPVVIETQWGRGGSATNAWNTEEVKPVVEVSEVKVVEENAHGIT